MAIEFEYKSIGAEATLREMERLRAELGLVEGATASAGGAAQASGSQWGDLSSRVTAGVMAFQAAAATIGASIAAVQRFGAEWERQAGIMRAFQGDVTEASNRLGGMTSRLALMETANRVAQTGLQLTAHEFANLAVAATKFADATGIDATQAMDQLAGAIAAGNTRSLAQFGINLGDITDKADKQAEALRQLNERFGDASEGANTLGGELDRVGVAMDDAMLDFGDGFSAIDPLAGAVDGLARALRDLGVELPRSASGLGFWAETGAAAAASVQVLVPRVNALLQAALKAKTGDWAGAIAAVERAFTGDLDAELGAATGERLRSIAVSRATRTGVASVGSGAGDDSRSGGRGGGGGSRNADMQFSADEAYAVTDPAILAAVAVTSMEAGGGRGGGMGGGGGGPSPWEEGVDEAAKLDDILVGINKNLEDQNVLLMEQAEIYAQVGNQVGELANGIGQLGMAMAKGGDPKKIFKEWAKGFAIQQAGAAIASFAEALGYTISGNPVQAGQAVVKGGLHLAAAAAVGALGGATPSSRAPSSAGGGGTARPESPSRGGQSSGEGSRTVIVNINSPMPEQELGRAQARASFEAERRFGRRAA